jgi:Nickel responsive protein SCO4226-like
MPRYVVERSFPELLAMTPDEAAAVCESMVEQNGEFGVTWMHSYVSADKRRSYDICEAPTPEAIRKTAACNNLPVDRITQVSVLDPYFYR